jgi:hypothetical protein
VHSFPSEHPLASSLVKTHRPLAGSQESSVHEFWSSQTIDGLPTHLPKTQASLVQAFPSEQGFVSSIVNTHWPLAGLHASSVHGFWSLQTTDGVPTHVPDTQASLVQALPSEQALALSFV